MAINHVAGVSHERLLRASESIAAFKAYIRAKAERQQATDNTLLSHLVAVEEDGHICSGLHLARLEARIAFQQLLGRLSSIEAISGPLQHRDNCNIRCPKRLLLCIAA